MIDQLQNKWIKNRKLDLDFYEIFCSRRGERNHMIDQLQNKWIKNRKLDLDFYEIFCSRRGEKNHMIDQLQVNDMLFVCLHYFIYNGRFVFLYYFKFCVN
jgi:hypothetical protein